MSSDPLHSVVDVSLFDELFWSDDDLYRNQQCPLLGKKSSSVLPEEGPLWLGSEDCVALSKNAESVGTQSDSDVDVVKDVQGWVNDNKLPTMKRRQTGFLAEVQAPANHTRERQRGKNWEKMEEDILVESKGKEMDWKSISECLKSKGFNRDHRHCSDKWYALRKHYIEIQQWMIQNPNTNYWDLTDTDRIRTVPPSFCQRWYAIFDAACQKPELRKRAHQNLNPRQRPGDSGQHLAPADDPSPSHFVGGLGLDSSLRSYPAFSARPSCKPSVPQKGSEPYVAGDRLYSGDAAHENECLGAGDRFPNQTTVEYPNVPYSDIGVLLAEIRELSHTLKRKFAAEEEERMRNLKIKERKLQLKIERFRYKRHRDEEMRKRPSLMP